MADLKREEEIEIVVKNLSGLTALRRFTNTQSFDWLEDVSNKLLTIISEKREEEELRRLELSE
ncbi:DNA-binding protein, partial [Acinetobacter baumannii]|nr:DNA-binding protein [Acinetobacter baumannii]